MFCEKISDSSIPGSTMDRDVLIGGIKIMSNRGNIILGAGLSGLSAGMASGFPIYEKNDIPGGICASYYMGGDKKFYENTKNENLYRFETGGGHWIWGDNPFILHFIKSMVSIKRYNRRAGIYFASSGKIIPYPLQYNLRYFDTKIVVEVLQEIIQNQFNKIPVKTMSEWLYTSFGPTLNNVFFTPFNKLYTAGLYDKITPPDNSKSPLNLPLIIQGSFQEVCQAGYNSTFIYPKEGLNILAKKMAEKCRISYNKIIKKIDIDSKVIYFEDDSEIFYNNLISTIPLNKILEITDIKVNIKPSPFTSVLVINIGAVIGKKCPQEQWLYIPDTKSGVHRVGFYSNVDETFLPKSCRKEQKTCSIYVEKAYLGGYKPDSKEVEMLCRQVVEELKEWEWIKQVEVVDPTWIETAYTWRTPDSIWAKTALDILKKHNIYQIGRYGRWANDLVNEGIIESIKNGFVAGKALQII